MTAASPGAAIARAMRVVEMIAAMTTAAIATVAMTTAATTAVLVRALADQKADRDQIVARRQVVVPKGADRAPVRPAVRRCGTRVAMTTTMMMMTVRLGHAANSAGPAWVPAAQAGCPALVARRSMVVEWAEWVDLVADLKAPDGCPDSAAPPLVACPECPALAAFPAAGPGLAAGQIMSMIVSPRWSAGSPQWNARCAPNANSGGRKGIARKGSAALKRAVRKAAATTIVVAPRPEKATSVVPKDAPAEKVADPTPADRVVLDFHPAGPALVLPGVRADLAAPEIVVPKVAAVLTGLPIAKGRAASAMATACSSRR